MNFKFQERYEASKDPIIIGLPEHPENLPDFDVREFYVQLVADLKNRGL